MPSLLRTTATLLGLLATSGCSSFLGHARSPEHVVRGPLPSRAQQPLQLTVLGFRPRRAHTQPKGQFGFTAQLAYSSIEEVRTRNGQQVGIDGELARLVLRTRYGLSEYSDVEVELPFLYASGGFMDTFVDFWHQLFSLPDGNRNDTPDDLYRMEIVSDDEVLYRLEGEHVGVQDIPVFFTTNVLAEDEGRPAVAVRAGVELPTGDEQRGFGNGALDWGMGVVTEKSLGRWTLNGGLDFTYAGQSSSFELSPLHSIENLFGADLGVEYRWSNAVSVVLTGRWTSAILQSINFPEINSGILDVGLGLAWDLGRASRMSLSFQEDFIAGSGPDFGVLLVWSTGM